MKREKKMKRINTVAVFLLIILIPLITCLLSSRLVAFNLGFYNDKFEEYKPEINNPLGITKDLLTYLKHPSAGPEYLVSFNEEEISHLQDVKKLFQIGLWSLYISAIIAVILLYLVYYINKENVSQLYVKFGSIFAKAGALTIVLGTVFKFLITDFKTAFVEFHNIFFRQGGWQFPPGYTLVELFPQKFFIDAVNSIVLRIFVTAFVLLIAGILTVLIIKKIKRSGHNG
jgi:integral membrane protein (TIGR01906 family)